MARSNFVNDTMWLGSEFLKIFYSPAGVTGGFIDAFRGWKFSRSKARFWFHLPSMVLLVTVYLIFGFSIFSRKDSRIQLFSVESEGRCPTKTIEATCEEMFEEDFCKAIGLTGTEKIVYKTFPIPDLTKRYIELLSKRILSIQPSNQVAHYRLGMIYSIRGQSEEALLIMSELASGKFGDCPQANAWMAKDLLKQKAAGIDVPAHVLLTILEKAPKWKYVDSRLISYYARTLEDMGETLKAISVAKQAAATKPELNLELARLYSRIGFQEELKSAANLVEDFFMKRLNSPLEKESDRLAVAEARRMTNRLEQAAEILTEGLLNKSSGPRIKRELSEIQRLIYLKSVSQTEDGVYLASLSLLEKAADTDPSNPNISEEIAKLLPLKIKPTKKLMDVLKKQIDMDITNVSTHILLAEEFFSLGNNKEAIKNWEQALNKDPSHIGAMNDLALCLSKASEKNTDRSLELLNKALSLSTRNPEILDSLGDVLMMAQRPKDAINKYELAIRNDNGRIETRKKLVKAYQANGMDDMAKALTTVIQKMEKDNVEEEVKPPEITDLN